MIQKYSIIDDVQRRTLWKGGMMHEDIIKQRDDAGGHFRREG